MFRLVLLCLTLALSLFSPVLSLRGLHGKRTLAAVMDLKSDIKKAIQLAQDAFEVIYYRYQMDEPKGKAFRRQSINMDQESFDFMKYQFAKKIVGDNSVYNAVFGGSSVTAGHDNKYNESYPEVFGRKIGPVLEALGIQPNIRNIAQGANNCYPSNACYESMGGFDPDFINWEQSFNCGHNPDFFELAARFALWSKNPGLVFYSQSGSMPCGQGCNASRFPVRYGSEAWTPRTVNKPSFRASWDDIKELIGEMVKSHKELGPTAMRFGGAALNYKKLGAPLALSGFSLWETRKEEECAAVGFSNPKQCGVGRFYSNTDCSENMLFCQEKESLLYGSPSGRGAGHHPTVALHMYRGETIAYLVMLPLMDAMYMVLDDVEKGSTKKQELFKKYSDTYESLYKLKTMPPPSFCPKTENEKAYYYCDVKPLCYTDYHPHYAHNYSLTELLVGTTKWEYNFKDYQNWHFPDTSHLELRPGYSATNGPESGEIHFKINVGNVGVVGITGYHYGSMMTSYEFLIELDVSNERLKNYTPDSSKWKIWPHKPPDKSMSNMAVVSNIPPGQHVMSIRSKKDDNKVNAGITHIMMYENK